MEGEREGRAAGMRLQPGLENKGEALQRPALSWCTPQAQGMLRGRAGGREGTAREEPLGLSGQRLFSFQAEGTLCTVQYTHLMPVLAEVFTDFQCPVPAPISVSLGMPGVSSRYSLFPSWTTLFCP